RIHRRKQVEHADQGRHGGHDRGVLRLRRRARKGGHFVRGEALQSARNAVTLRWQNGKVSVIDGPYAETKEVLGGILVLEARDLSHAIQLMSKHPGVRLGGPFEIRPLDEELTARVNARNP